MPRTPSMRWEESPFGSMADRKSKTRAGWRILAIWGDSRVESSEQDGPAEQIGRISMDDRVVLAPTTNISSPGKVRRVALLGSTGSIGKSTLDVVAHFPDRLTITGLSAHSRGPELVEQARQFRPQWIALTDPKAAQNIDKTQLPAGVDWVVGPEALARKVAGDDVDVVVTAIVGSAGLLSTWAALEAGKDIAVANKETLVMAGPLVMDLAQQRGARIMPVDSEHSALFQALCSGKRSDVRKLILTGSGGPFRGKSKAELALVTPEQALNHPTWKMGPKITVDSATLMNKALEVIETRWLFGVSAEKIDVVIHPESVVHSLVEFEDGSILAQASPPDMRLPIQLALLWPDRPSGPTRRLHWGSPFAWHFEPPDTENFPALRLGFEVARQGGTAGAVLNAANEVAVGRFLQGDLAFLDIAKATGQVLANHEYSAHPELGELTRLDGWARREVARWK